MLADKIKSLLPSSVAGLLGRNAIVRAIIKVCEKMEFLPYLSSRHQNNILRRIKSNISSGEKVAVAFVVSENQIWATESLFQEFLKDPLYDVEFFLVLPVRTVLRDATVENMHFFDNKQAKVIKTYGIDEINNVQCTKQGPDIVFIDQPWIALEVIKQFSKRALVCYVPYGIMQAKIQKIQFNHILHNISWKIFCETPIHKKLYEKYSDQKGKNVVVSGYPKLDKYLKPVKRNATDRWGSDPEKKRIIWAPHHSLGERDLVRYATFDKNHKFFYKYVKDHPDIEFILKPHPMLGRGVVDSGIMNKLDFEEYLKQFNALPNARVYDEGDYIGLFMTSDALITDSISFLAEYLPTKNPILFLERTDNTGFNEYGEKIIESYYKAHNNDDIEDFIEKVVIDGKDYLYVKRMNTLKECIYFPGDKSAGQFIKDYLNKIFIEDHDKKDKTGRCFR